MDRRDTNHQWYSDFDAKRMILTIEVGYEDVEVPAVYAVCGTCDGKGTHVNPSIDSHGLSREDFDEDPDFAEDYFSGAYDQPCNECGGQRVVPEMDETRTDPALVQQVIDRMDGHYEDMREQANERRMGY